MREHLKIMLVLQLSLFNRYRILQSLQIEDPHYKHDEIADKVGFSEYKMFS